MATNPINDSSTGGYLLSEETPLDDDALADVLQPFFVGLTGLDDTLVRPKYQNPIPEQPDTSTTWLAFWVKNRNRDWDAFRHHVRDKASDGGFGVQPFGTSEFGGNGETTAPAFDFIYSNELFSVDITIYGPGCENAASSIWNNVRVPQNLEALGKSSIRYVSVDDPQPMSELIKQVWVRRLDFRMHLRRAICLRYRVLDLASAELTVITPPVTNVLTITSSTEEDS